jgi:D-xylulose reductase
VRIHTVGICGSDVHYYTYGRIGPFVVQQPMILGHEASGVVIEVGDRVTSLAIGDRVCMEPGIPDPTSRASRQGIYNVDPAVTFWATPPVHGCLIEEVVHPASFTYALPENVSFAEGAMVEPLAVGVHAATQARLKPGDTVAVIGAGPIGMMAALAALAGGASRVIISDVAAPKLDIIGRYPGITTVNVRETPLPKRIAELTAGIGADVVFEASGNPGVFADLARCAAPGGALVLIGMPVDPVPFDVTLAQVKELRIQTIFRYANVYERAIRLIASGKVDLKPLLSETYPFDAAIEAFERAASARPGDVKLQISLAS